MKKVKWPGGAPFAICPTHDVDKIKKYPYHYLYYGITGGRKGIRNQFSSLRERLSGKDPYWNFENLMELEELLGIRSTFFFLNENARGFGPTFWGRYDINSKTVKSIIRMLDRGGWEIGLHGSFFSYNNYQMLREEKAILEDILGKAVRSCRQHYLNLAPGKTWQFQRNVGLEFDSSVGHSHKVNDCMQHAFPFNTEESILELPVTIMDTIGLEKPLVRERAWQVLHSIANAGGLIVLDWHQCAFNEKENLSRVFFYREVLDYGKSLGAWITTIAAIGYYWKQKTG